MYSVGKPHLLHIVCLKLKITTTIRSSSCTEGTWVDGHLDGRAIKDNDYGGWEVSPDFLFLLMSVGEATHLSIRLAVIC